jgi:cyclopropane fatty-acyl-phospholipid synthase-like methyltransferase
MVAAGDLRPCRILVPGCGRGHEVVALARAGFAVTGVDFAPAAAAALQARLADEGLPAELARQQHPPGLLELTGVLRRR